MLDADPRAKELTNVALPDAITHQCVIAMPWVD